MADHVQRVMKPNFLASWEEVGEENEVNETFALSAKTLEGKSHDLNVMSCLKGTGHYW